MGKLTELAMKAMEVRTSSLYFTLGPSELTVTPPRSQQNDTQLVSILYRTHKTLPTASKVSSLYAFDALSRAARSQVNKHGLTGDINSEKGNCATFLLKVEGVLDGLFNDLISTGSPETKVSIVH
jgi:protein NRD1